jgi:hypothetical protein
MRPNHQNKRMRGRNRGSGGGGGKGPNPLTRSYESNGPDVKVRGTAQSIAEKYVQLGRDAQASGDHVQAESFFQHAEHYYRLIAAAQEQFRLQNPGFRGFDQPEGDDEGGDEEPFGHSQPQPDVQPNFTGGDAGEQGDQPQEYQPREQREYRDNREQRDNRDFNNRGPRPQRDNRNFQPRDNRNFQPREPREPREGQFGEQPSYEQRDERREDRRPQREHQPREHQPRDNPRFERGPRRFDRDQQPAIAEGEQPGLPSFITAPSRTPVMPVESESTAGMPVEPNLSEPVGIRRRGRPPRVRPIEDTPVGE